MRICFFANMSDHANWREMFEKVEFYRVDIHLLKELGHEVVLAGNPGSLDWHADLYYSWWWGHAPYSIALGKLTRRPVIVTGAFDYATCRDEIPGLCYLDRPRWQRLVLRTALRLADANLFISKYEYDEVTRNLAVRNPVLAPLAVDTDYYCPRAHPPFTSDYFFSVSWTSATNAVRKGLPQTIAAFARVARQLAHVRLVLAGKPGDYHEELCNLAERLGVRKRVEFVGMISDEQKLEYYRNCIAYVQPTLYEGFGHAIAEAVATGCPVVSSDRGAVPEVAGRFARCVNPKDESEIADAMSAYANTVRSQEYESEAHRWIVDKYSFAVRRALLADVLARYSS